VEIRISDCSDGGLVCWPRMQDPHPGLLFLSYIGFGSESRILV